MRIQKKITLSFVAVLAVSSILLSTVLTLDSESRVVAELTKQAEQRLIGFRDVKREQIERYFEQIENQVLTLANSTMTRQALVTFKDAFHGYLDEQSDVDLTARKTALARYYQQDFGAKYSELNPGKKASVPALLDPLEDVTIALQYDLIAANPNPLGSKDELAVIPRPSLYGNYHSLFHPVFRQYLQAFGYYDIFIADAQTGHVIYSVFKELDFATSLKTGPYQNSGLGKAFKNALPLKQGETAIIDFAPYGPSYDAPASFIATPIFEEGVVEGVLIFQMPVDRLNEIMTYKQNWKQSGLGASGETYLVGQDGLLRSESRFLIEDKTGYLAAIKQAGVTPDIVAEISAKGSSMGLQPVNTLAAKKALSGQAGFDVVLDYRNVPVYSAFAPLNIKGLQWAVLSEIDEEEALLAVKNLTRSQTLVSVLVTLVLVALGAFVAHNLGRILSRPITHMLKSIEEIAGTLNVSVRIARYGKSNDEISDMAKAINHMLIAFDNVLRNAKQTSKNLNDSLSQLNTGVVNVAETSTKQNDMTLSLSSALDQMASTSETLKESAIESLSVTKQISSQAQSGLSAVEGNRQVTGELDHVLKGTSDHVAEVANLASNIVTVLDTIQSIAEQTNLLALNAAIEAARAGEQGRGFAVVADEVRTLAQRTQDSTTEIQKIIEELQAGSKMSVEAMTKAVEIVEKTMHSAGQTTDAFENISQQLAALTRQGGQVVQASEEQYSVSNNMAQSVADISELAADNRNQMKNVSEINKLVAKANKELEQSMAQFRIEG